MTERPGISALDELVPDLLARGHRARFLASGDSMHPTIREGDVIEVEPLDEADRIATEQILLVAATRGLTVHRLVERLDDGRYVTRGDNATGDDEPVGRDRILGRITCRERGGRTSRMTGLWPVARQRLVLVAARVVRALRRRGR